MSRYATHYCEWIKRYESVNGTQIAPHWADRSACGRFTDDCTIQTDDWESVTCRKCLKTREVSQ